MKALKLLAELILLRRVGGVEDDLEVGHELVHFPKKVLVIPPFEDRVDTTINVARDVEMLSCWRHDGPIGSNVTPSPDWTFRKASRNLMETGSFLTLIACPGKLTEFRLLVRSEEHQLR